MSKRLQLDKRVRCHVTLTPTATEIVRQAMRWTGASRSEVIELAVRGHLERIKAEMRPASVQVQPAMPSRPLA